MDSHRIVGDDVVQQGRTGVLGDDDARGLTWRTDDRVVDDAAERNRRRLRGRRARITTVFDTRLVAERHDIVAHHDTRQQVPVIEQSGQASRAIEGDLGVRVACAGIDQDTPLA